MGIEKRGDTWFIRYTDVGGRRRRRRTFARTEEQAYRLWLDLAHKIERQKLGLEPLSLNPEGWTLAKLMNWWLDTHSARTSSHDRDRSYLTTHILSDGELASLPLEHVTAGRIERFLLSKTELKPKTLNHLRAYFSRAFAAAKDIEVWLGENPTARVKKRRVPRPTHAVLDVHEVPRLLAAANAPWREIFAVALYAGLRKGEIFGLRADDVDLAHDLLFVRRSHDRETTKSGRGRVVPIHPELRPHIEAALDARGSSVWLFPAEDGGQMNDRHKVGDRLAAALVRAGFIRAYTWKCRRKGCGYAEVEVPTSEAHVCPRCAFQLWSVPLARKLRFHDLRHTAATLYLQAGADLHAVQRILGHSSPVITTKTYGHLDQKYIREQMLKLAVGAMPEPAVGGEGGAEVVDLAAARRARTPDS